MNQQINLFQPMFRRQKKVFSATTIVQTILLFIVAFALIYGYSLSRESGLRDELKKLDVNVAYLKQQKMKLDNQYPVRTKSKLLEAEIARLQAELDGRKQIEALLAGNALGNTHGFSSYLEAFARRHVEGMWLTRVTIADGGNSLGLAGRTLSSELVPQYIEQLGEDNAMKGKAFNVMTMQRLESEPRQISFNISTE